MKSKFFKPLIFKDITLYTGCHMDGIDFKELLRLHFGYQAFPPSFLWWNNLFYIFNLAHFSNLDIAENLNNVSNHNF